MLIGRALATPHGRRIGQLAALSTLFIATNLSIGYALSTVAQNQLQATQMAIMFLLPNILFIGLHLALMLVAMTIAVIRFRRTLD